MHSVAVFVVCYGYAHNLCGFGGGLVVGHGSEWCLVCVLVGVFAPVCIGW